MFVNDLFNQYANIFLSWSPRPSDELIDEVELRAKKENNFG